MASSLDPLLSVDEGLKPTEAKRRRRGRRPPGAAQPAAPPVRGSVRAALPPRRVSLSFR